MAKTVMVVDGSASLRLLVCITLKGAGYDVVEACDGKDCLSKIDSQTVHLVITDVNMPNMDGIAFVNELKKRSDCKFVPVIMLTTENQHAKIQEEKMAGAKAWVVKPFRPAQMLSAVEKLIMP